MLTLAQTKNDNKNQMIKDNEFLVTLGKRDLLMGSH